MRGYKIIFVTVLMLGFVISLPAQINNPPAGGGGSTCGTPTCTVSSAGSGNGVLALSGNTSGTSTFTANAIAGTSTNPVVMSNTIQGPVGTVTAPTFQVGTFSDGMSSAGQGAVLFSTNNNKGALLQVGNLRIPQGSVFCFSNTANDASQACDTGASRLIGDSIGFGNGTAADTSATVTFKAQASNTNCSAVGTAASPSVASCGSAMAGSFSCATNASAGNCTVNTTAVTANSEIFVTQRADTTTGTRLGVTCNTTLSTVITQITAVTAATSFTINLGTIATNPECFSYYILN